jgi:hypothetical protein
LLKSPYQQTKIFYWPFLFQCQTLPLTLVEVLVLAETPAPLPPDVLNFSALEVGFAGL